MPENTLVQKQNYLHTPTAALSNQENGANERKCNLQISSYSEIPFLIAEKKNERKSDHEREEFYNTKPASKMTRALNDITALPPPVFSY